MLYQVQPVSAYNMPVSVGTADLAYDVMATSPATDLPDLNNAAYELA